MQTAAVIEFGSSTGLGVVRTLALVLANALEIPSSRGTRRRPDADEAGCVGDLEEQAHFPPAPGPLFDLFEQTFGPEPEGYTVESFAMLMREMLAAGLHRVSVESPEFEAFLVTRQ